MLFINYILFLIKYKKNKNFKFSAIIFFIDFILSKSTTFLFYIFIKLLIGFANVFFRSFINKIMLIKEKIAICLSKLLLKKIKKIF